MPETGEYLVGAWLKLCGGCEIVVYNQKVSPKGPRMNEVDVIGLEPQGYRAYFCEVATHLGGLLYSGGNKDTMRRIENKFKADVEYAHRTFLGWQVHHMLWAPYVPKGMLTSSLTDLQSKLKADGVDLHLIINQEYTLSVDQLRELAGTETRDRGESFYRALQILEHLR